MKKRVISAAVGIPLIILLAWLGGHYWTVLVWLAALLSLFEFYRGVKTSGNRPLWLVGLMVIAWAMTLTRVLWWHPGSIGSDTVDPDISYFIPQIPYN